jgi:hypothetical protein
MQKIVIKLSKIWFWDPGSGIQGVKNAPDPQHCDLHSFAIINIVE